MALSWVVWKDSARVRNASESRPSMRFGERGDAVHFLQAALILNNIDVPDHGVGRSRVRNDNYLTQTRSAVRTLEERFSLNLDEGIAGRQVIGTLDRETDRFYQSHAGHFGSDLAVQDAPLARSKVERAIIGLIALRASMGGPGPSPFSVVNDALRVHFRLLAPGTTGPAVARAATRADVTQILQTFLNIAFVLRGATFTFRDGIPFNGVKIAAESQTNSRRVLFGPTFRDFDGPFGTRIGPQSRVAILIHESMHSVDASNSSGNDDIHISEFDPAYDTQPADRALFNPSSYAGFAAHVFLGRDPQPRFGLGPNSRAL